MNLRHFPLQYLCRALDPKLPNLKIPFVGLLSLSASLELTCLSWTVTLTFKIESLIEFEVVVFLSYYTGRGNQSNRIVFFLVFLHNFISVPQQFFWVHLVP